MYVYKVKKLYNDMREPLKSKVVLCQYKHCVWSVYSNGMRLGSGGQLKWLYTTPVGYQDVCRGSLGNLGHCVHGLRFMCTTNSAYRHTIRGAHHFGVCLQWQLFPLVLRCYSNQYQKQQTGTW